MSIFKLTPTPATLTPKKEVYIKGQAVGESRDLRRVLALPSRARPDYETLIQWAAELKAELGTGITTCECESKYKRRCCADLLPVQAWVLHEAREVGGILGPIGVGHGKSLCDLLVAMVAKDCHTAVLFLPSNLKSQMLEVDWHFYGQHWKLPNLAGGTWLRPNRPTLHVVSYSELSGSKSTDLLSKLKPDTLVLDEAHNARNRTAARTKRIFRYFSENIATKLFAWSGTLTAKSLRDYATLSHYALKEQTPAPIHQPTVEEWAGHLDPSDFRSPPGRLSQFKSGAESVVEAYARRVTETKGVVSSGDVSACQATLVISKRDLTTPEVIQKHIDDLEKTWARPDGEELVDAMSKARCAKQLSCGFYYRWRWPRKEPTEVIERWLEARKNWHKELREKLKHSRPHMDSPLLCAKAAIRWYKGYTHVEKDEEGNELKRVALPPETKQGPLPTWAAAHWPEWEQVRGTAQPETEAVWLSDFFVDDCLKWLIEGPGLLWYEFDGLAKRILRVGEGEASKLTYCGPGEDGNRRVLSLFGQERVVASTRAHGTGKNLQQFSRNLVANPPSSGAEWEQLIGRTHRAGQKEDQVTVETYNHTEAFRDSLERARELSQHIQDSFGSTQKLVSKATWTF